MLKIEFHKMNLENEIFENQLSSKMLKTGFCITTDSLGVNFFNMDFLNEFEPF